MRGKTARSTHMGDLKMEIKEGWYAFVYDIANPGNAKGAAYIGWLPEKGESIEPFRGLEYEQRLSEFDLTHISATKFRERYKSDYYYVVFLQILKEPYLVEDIPKERFIIYPYDWTEEESESNELTGEQLLSLKLLLKESLKISAGRQKPLALAIDIANEVRNISGYNIENVTQRVSRATRQKLCRVARNTKPIQFVGYIGTCRSPTNTSNTQRPDSNGYKRRLWKTELQRLANFMGVNITVCHFPPGTSTVKK